MMFFMFLAACWASAWCFDHNRPGLAILIGCLFAAFYLIDRRMNGEDEDEDGI